MNSKQTQINLNKILGYLPVIEFYEQWFGEDKRGNEILLKDDFFRIDTAKLHLLDDVDFSYIEPIFVKLLAKLQLMPDSKKLNLVYDIEDSMTITQDDWWTDELSTKKEPDIKIAVAGDIGDYRYE